jgi:hypothetical protein
MEKDTKEIAKRINEILRMGQKAQSKEEQEKIAKMLSQFSTDYSSPEYPKMSASEFASSDAQKAALSPQEILNSYYGENLPKEIIRAGNYNIVRPTIMPQSYSNIFDKIPAIKNAEYGSSYSPNNNAKPMIELSSGRGFEINQENQKKYRKLLNENKPSKLKSAISAFFKENSFDPSIPASKSKSTLEHEVGHHITQADKSETLPYSASRYAAMASDGFSKFGKHTGLIDETTQALGRLQREMFKNTGKRLYPAQFMNLVNKKEIPDFLTQEGRRILIYAQNLKDVADKSKNEDEKESAKRALKAISRMAPAVVQNKKQNGLNLPIG